MVTKHLRITGRVQGVGYRNYMEYKARQFHITGWVRNRIDGSVEAVIQGTQENVEALAALQQQALMTFMPPLMRLTESTRKHDTGKPAERKP